MWAVNWKTVNVSGEIKDVVVSSETRDVNDKVKVMNVSINMKRMNVSNKVKDMSGEMKDVAVNSEERCEWWDERNDCKRWDERCNNHRNFIYTGMWFSLCALRSERNTHPPFLERMMWHQCVKLRIYILMITESLLNKESDCC